jgi:DUF917 family protein/N-methylhydantoinase A/oxoprolinase/acetone carboxylase beta subunit
VPAPDCRLGIDVGGTNTDAVIMDTADRVIAKAKVPTTPDITGGVASAIDTVLAAPGVEPGRISHVMLGTTHATNAVLERRNLRRVAVLRLGGPATLSIRPMFGWPADLAGTISVGAAVVDGGIEFDGQDLSPLDTEAIARFLGQVGDQAEGIAITSVFAPVAPRHELEAADVVKRELGEVHVSLSHEIGSIGLLERENATILNGALAGVASDVARAMRSALTVHGLQPVTYFAQNDGTLMSLDQALRYPVLTIGSGPANSVRGAAFLTGISDSLVVDVGGTSTDVGVLVNGFPRESSYGVEIGGIRTNFRMPDLVTIALGGGTIVSDASNGSHGIGPRSVGYRLLAEALVFGGTTATLTDCAVAAGRAAVGDAARIGPHRARLTEALAQADMMLAEAIDRVKTSQDARPLIAVGGGSILVPDQIPGVSEIIRPEHFDAANAVGAAIASVSGQVDRIFHVGAGGRQAVLDEAQEDARERAIAAGADPDAVQIIEIEEIPLAYLTSPAIRVRVKAAGALGGVPDRQLAARLAQQARLADPVADLVPAMKRLLDPASLRALARGCAVLGAGGGGDTQLGLLQALQATEDFGAVPLMDLDELPDDGLIMPCGGIGAPTVSIEKIENGDEGPRLRHYLEALSGRRVAALMAGEIGGGNGLIPITWAARMGLPVVDADGMGRAFPEVSQVTMHLAGISPSPAVMTDERGNLVVFRAVSVDWMERLERAAAIGFGGAASSTEYALTASQAREATVRNSVSLAISIGEAVGRSAGDPVAAMIAQLGAFRLIIGKIQDVERRTTSGFAAGSVSIEGLGQDAGRLVRLELQNENLVALERGQVLASVPDLISVLDSETADAIGTERIAYGQRVTVIAFACAPIWRTERGIALTGPRAFGYDFDYSPVEELADAAPG